MDFKILNPKFPQKMRWTNLLFPRELLQLDLDPGKLSKEVKCGPQSAGGLWLRILDQNKSVFFKKKSKTALNFSWSISQASRDWFGQDIFFW